MKLLTDIRNELLVAAAAALLLIGVLTGTPSAMAAGRPNFVVIQTDDQSPALLDSKYRGKDGVYRKTMPNTLRQIVRSGTEFRNYYATSPVCSPSRASLLTGQYPQNNGLLTNNGAIGGWSGWKALPIRKKNLPLALERVGYRTAHFGKFINSYYNPNTGGGTREVPRGWSRWFTASFRSGDNRFYGYTVNDNGRLRGPLGNRRYRNYKKSDPASCEISTPSVRIRSNDRNGGNGQERKSLKVTCDYSTDVFSRKAVRELGNRNTKPFYLQIDYDAPHGDVRPPEGPQPATRHIGAAARTPLPKGGSFNEINFSDKPSLVRQAAPRRLSRKEKKDLKLAYRRQLESLMAVDEGVGEIVKVLRRTGELDNTYIFFVSDHGFFLGEHRFALAKFLPYEASSSVSMAVRGPGVSKDSSVGEPVGNIDIPASIYDLANVSPGYRLDGRSLRRFWRDPGRRSRRAVAISLRGPADAASISGKAPALRYKGFRVGPYKLIRYWSGESELYDLSRDPHELRNSYKDPAYLEVRDYMSTWFDQVVNCAAARCREQLPPWPQPSLP